MRMIPCVFLFCCLASCRNEPAIDVTFVLPDGYVGAFYVDGKMSHNPRSTKRPESLVLRVDDSGVIRDPNAAWLFDSILTTRAEYASGVTIPTDNADGLTAPDAVAFRDGFTSLANNRIERIWYVVDTEAEYFKFLDGGEVTWKGSRLPLTAGQSEQRRP